MKALVTGANKGIGYQIAKQLKEQGYDVYVGARDKAKGEAAAKEIGGTFVKIDLDDYKTFANVKRKIGELDLLVNNAGIPGDMEKSPLVFETDELRRTMDVNFFATYELTKQVLPLLTGNGKIVNISIPTYYSKMFHPLAYMTSKSAQNTFTHLIGETFKANKSNQQIFGIMPGPVATDLNGAKSNLIVKTPKKAGRVIVKAITSNHNYNGKIIDRNGWIINLFRPFL